MMKYTHNSKKKKLLKRTGLNLEQLIDKQTTGNFKVFNRRNKETPTLAS